MRITGADGVGVAVHVSGDAELPTPVCVHGYPDDNALWDGVAAELLGRLAIAGLRRTRPRSTLPSSLSIQDYLRGIQLYRANLLPRLRRTHAGEIARLVTGHATGWPYPDHHGEAEHRGAGAHRVRRARTSGHHQRGRHAPGVDHLGWTGR